jgi:hypothetical protein
MEKYRVKKYISLIEKLQSLFAVSAANGIMADKLHCIIVCLDLFEKLSTLPQMANACLDKYISGVVVLDSVSDEAVNRIFFEFRDLLDNVHTRFIEIDQ